MTRIIGESIPNIPWQDNVTDAPIWRYSANPVIGRNPTPNISRAFNSAVIAYKGGFVGVFRGETYTGIPYLYLGRSNDGINFTYDQQPINFTDAEGVSVKFEYAYDPRLVKIEDAYYVVWCESFHGPALGIARTYDFTQFTVLERPLLPCNRNGVLFPRKIKGEYVLLSRPSDGGHTAFGDIFSSRSKDFVYWGRHRHLLDAGYEWWQSLKIGAGCTPIETDEGWLLIYHGVNRTCSGYVYSMGGAILDADGEKVKYRCKNFLLTPEENYETVGFVPNVIFPCSALCDANSGRIAIYYGAADTVVGLAFTEINTIVDYIKKNAR